MKFFITGIFKVLVLIISIAIVYFSAKYGFKVSTDWEKNELNGTEQNITIGSALKYCKNGENVDKKVIAESIRKTIFVELPIPDFVCDFLDQKITTWYWSFYFEYYWYISMLAGLLCLILGVGQPFALYRNNNMVSRMCAAIDNKLIDKNYVLVDQYDIEHGHPGEGASMIVKFIILYLMAMLAALYGCVMIFTLIFDAVMTVLSIIFRISVFFISSALFNSELKKEKARKDIIAVSLYVENGLFKVEKNSTGECLFYKCYWNAVIAKRVLSCDIHNTSFKAKDAEETIQFGDEKKHAFFERMRLWDRIKSRFNSNKRNKNLEICDSIEHGNCITRMDSGSDTGSYIMEYTNNNMLSSIRFMVLENIALLHAVRRKDITNDIFEDYDWNKYAQLPIEEKAILINPSGFKVEAKDAFSETYDFDDETYNSDTL